MLFMVSNIHVRCCISQKYSLAKNNKAVRHAFATKDRVNCET